MCKGTTLGLLLTLTLVLGLAACSQSGKNGTGSAGAGAAGTSATAGASAGSAASSDGGTATAKGAAADGGDAALADTDAAAAGGCGLGLAPPAHGFQVCAVGTTIAAGEEAEYCEVVVLPGSPSDEYYVNRLQTKMTPYSHHLIILAADPGSSNEASMPAGKRVACTGGEQVFGQGLLNVTGSQRPTSDALYPDGVGKIYHGGQRLSFDYHYFNASTAPVMARAALNMYTVDKASIKHLAHQFGMYNLTFFVPVGQQKSFDKTCTFTRDIMVYEITRHTHKWGTDFNVWWAGGADDGKEVWTSHDFESEVNYVLPGAPVLMKAGTGFKFRCNFDNTSDHLLHFGTTTKDEMCILFGQWWDVTEMGHGDDQGCR